MEDDSVFPFGDSLPSEAEIDEWMAFDLSRAQKRRNRRGLYGLFFGEWCSDLFAKSHEVDAPVDAHSRVIKGGGANFWPWQDDEWVWCMTAMRMPSSDLIDGVATLRPVISLVDLT
jgi:hypothetical protein